MSATPIIDDIFEHRKKWEDLWWAMSEDDLLKYKEIRKFEVVQFYELFDRWTESIKKRIEKQKQQNG